MAGSESRHQNGGIQLQVDEEAGALYLRIADAPIVESEEVSPGVVMDFNDSEQVVGIEVLYTTGRGFIRM